MSTAIGEKRLSTKRAERDVRQRARQSKAQPDCRSTTIKSRFTKISLALSSGRDNHHPAATAEMAILIVAVFPSRLSRYTAHYAVDRAFRQYDAADPANRLVAGELEARWNRSLARVVEVEGKIAAHDATAAPPVVDSSTLGLMASNLKAVWAAPTTDARLKKRIVRTLIHEVVADIDDEASEIVLIVHWGGGAHSEMRLPKRRRGQRNSTSTNILEAVRQLVLIA